MVSEGIWMSLWSSRWTTTRWVSVPSARLGPLAMTVRAIATGRRRWSRTFPRKRSSASRPGVEHSFGDQPKTLEKQGKSAYVGGTRMTDYTDVPPNILARVRDACMRLPEADEEQSWAGKRWRIRKRTFAHVLAVDS